MADIYSLYDVVNLRTYRNSSQSIVEDLRARYKTAKYGQIGNFLPYDRLFTRIYSLDMPYKQKKADFLRMKFDVNSRLVNPQKPRLMAYRTRFGLPAHQQITNEAVLAESFKKYVHRTQNVLTYFGNEARYSF